MSESIAGVQSVELVPLTQIDATLQLSVRDIRNEEGVRRWMYTDGLIDVDEHLAWLERLKVDQRQIAFVVVGSDGQLVGLVSVNALDQLHKKADWAYYLTHSARGGLGSAIEFAFIDFVFYTLGIEKLNCEVIAGNDAVVKLHKKFLFQEEGFRRANILKDGVRTGVHFLGLTRDEWIVGREKVRADYGRVLDKFAVSIRW